MCSISMTFVVFFFLMIRRPPRSTQSRSSAASDVYKRQKEFNAFEKGIGMDALVKIGEAAEYVGLPEKTIRYYEDVGLVAPLRAENGFRQFRSSDLRALRIIKNARNLGFSVEDSRALLDLFMNQDLSLIHISEPTRPY
eukprot:TRINITY_DN783_c0_g1_i1.p1 TRINITY_DN783_c0_g1~~TRINITY_DN783_c0_g1_i1.p1  ORF type:complete len:139 (-),score=60.42 TRINITY_DN783_c0_g1_i1:92-508(-)